MILQSIPALPESSLVERLLFESPWPLVIAIAVLGVIATQQLLSRAMARAGGAVFIASAGLVTGLVLLSNAVVTDREALRLASVDLVDRVVAVSAREPGAAEALRDQLDDVILLTDIPGTPPEITRPVLITLIQSRLDGGMTIADHRVREVQATTDGPNVARSHVLVRATPTSLGRPVNTAWRMHWQRDHADGPWILVELEMIDIDGWAKGRR